MFNLGAPPNSARAPRRLASLRCAALVIALAWCLELDSAAAQTLPPTNRPLGTIAFGSCSDPDLPLPVFDTVAKARPDLVLLLGDNVYAHTHDMQVLRATYERLGRLATYRRLLAASPLWAIWDDHDLGDNDVGGDYPPKEASRQIFLDFFHEAANSPRREREGLYDAQTFGPPGQRTQIILLDTRYFRDPWLPRQEIEKGYKYQPNLDPHATMLGAAQWTWLEEQLQQPAELRLLCSSIAVVNIDSPGEHWGLFPRERERLFSLVRSTQARGVIVLSGDRHLAELSVVNADLGYPLFDFCASGFNKGYKRWYWPHALDRNRYRSAVMNRGDNFGWIRVDWQPADPLVVLEARDVLGEVAFSQRLRLSRLRPGSLPPRHP